MAVLILFVFYCHIPNPNMILIAGLVLCSALFGYGGGIVAAAIMFGYTLFFFSTDYSFTQFTPQNMQKVFVSVIGIVADMVLVCALKRAEIREFKVVNELTVQLNNQKESLSSLLNHMPAMSFYKDAKTGVYLACNQAFAEYAHKETPSGVVGLTDYEIFDTATARHFAEDDKKALSMEVPYIFSEDVPDAAGNQKQFQTTKLKFIDETGRLCLLGMCMDVTEVVRIRKENEQTRAAYQQALSTSAVYESVVNALSEDYFNLYYVDLETDEFIEYGSRTDKEYRMNGVHGSHFFSEAGRNALIYVYEKDREQFIARMNKERLLKEIEKHGSVIYPYRLLIDGEPVYVSMKIKRNDQHIIIGVSNVDTQVKDRMAAARAAEEKKTYQRLTALNGNLIVLYYVDLESDQYTEFSASKEYEDLGISKHGSDFFSTTYENSLRTIHPEDQALFHSQVTKENILATINRDGIFVLDYRLMSGDLPTYVRLKAAKVEEDGKSILIIGLLDEDAQIRQEQEYARNLSAARKIATIDSLTGVKNKHAYVQWEEKINDGINEGTQEPFAVVVCDINNLKAVNDLYGHKEGDVCIRNGCLKICRVFSHSPVFRIGGDEFVVILSGEDYCQRTKLMEQINELPANRSKIRIGETIAAGIVEYDPHQHYSLSSVLKRPTRLCTSESSA
jgi:diguanylate cyclase (GGDEF)-like protein